MVERHRDGDYKGRDLPSDEDKQQQGLERQSPISPLWRHLYLHVYEYLEICIIVSILETDRSVDEDSFGVVTFDFQLNK